MGGDFMYQYPKQILTITQQLQSYIDAGTEITSTDEVEEALKTIGYYRLRGYSFQLYDNANKKYVQEQIKAFFDSKYKYAYPPPVVILFVTFIYIPNPI